MSATICPPKKLIENIFINKIKNNNIPSNKIYKYWKLSIDEAKMIMLNRKNTNNKNNKNTNKYDKIYNNLCELILHILNIFITLIFIYFLLYIYCIIYVIMYLDINYI